MASPPSRQAIDLAPQAPPRPVLAFILALLAVPGSTLAWDLPWGGLWIGLPLAVAAIVLGLRARREGVSKGLATAAVVIAGLCIAQMVAWIAVSVADGAGSSAAAGTLTLKQLDKGATFTHIQNKSRRSEQANLQGDLIASVSPLTNRAGKRAGKLHFSCITTLGARDFTKSKFSCTAIADLRDGTLISQFIDGIQPRTRGAITGGTGAYANARGTFVSKATKYGSKLTITFAQ